VLLKVLRQPLKKTQTHSGEHLVSILSVAHKYCMESIEETVIEHLKEGDATVHYIDLMVASRIVDSQSLYQQALEGLIKSEPKPTLVQARRIGLDAYHSIIVAASAASAATTTALVAESARACQNCGQSGFICFNCGHNL
jgi:hypothetical protein